MGRVRNGDSVTRLLKQKSASYWLGLVVTEGRSRRNMFNFRENEFGHCFAPRLRTKSNTCLYSTGFFDCYVCVSGNFRLLRF